MEEEFYQCLNSYSAKSEFNTFYKDYRQAFHPCLRRVDFSLKTPPVF